MADDDLDTGLDDDDADDGIDLTGGNTGGRKPAADADDDDDDTGDVDADDDADAKPVAAKKTYTQADVDKLTQSLVAARKEAREKQAALWKQLSELKAAQKPAVDVDDKVAAARAEAAEEAVKKFKPVAVRAAAKAAFLEANLQNPNDARVSRLVKNLDMDDIYIDEDTGAITGLDEQIGALVEEFAEMFTDPPATEAPKPKPRITRADGSDRKNEPPAPKSTGERIAQRILNQNR